MLKKIKKLKGYELQATDGDIGKVKEFYFDDKHWTIRYLVADTGGWLSNKKVLISPYALGIVDEVESTILTSLSKKQIENSPSIEADRPVSRQYEQSYHDYYGWPTYWTGPYTWGPSPYMQGLERWKESNLPKNSWDPHLRSTAAVAGYHVHALDGNIGHIDDFIVDDENWAIRYLVIDTNSWMPGRKVLVSPQWIQDVSWSDSKIEINLSKKSIKGSPEYNDEALILRSDEEEFYRYYGRETYWPREKSVKADYRINM
jgi:uncharacterized protein YrrD